MLISAYRQGIFPWYEEGRPILWWSPEPRFVLLPEELHISRSLRKFLKKRPFTFTIDAAFIEVIRACKSVERPRQEGTWITNLMVKGYQQLFELGYAHSLEVWCDGGLAGGLYGVSVGSIFAGESMFSFRSNASKAALAALVTASRDSYALIDCQVYTDHLAAMGAREISRREYLSQLKTALLRTPDPREERGRWCAIDIDYAATELAGEP